MKPKNIFQVALLLLISLNLYSQDLKKWYSNQIALTANARIFPDKGYYIEGDTVEIHLEFNLDEHNPNYYEGYRVEILNSFLTGFENEQMIVEFSSFDSLIIISEEFENIEGIIRFRVKDFQNIVRINFGAFEVFNNSEEIIKLIDLGEISENDPDIEWYFNHKGSMIISFSNDASQLSERRKKSIQKNLQRNLMIDTDKTKIKNAHLILLGTYGISIGFGEIVYLSEKSKEVSINFQYRSNKDYFSTGLYGQVRSYSNLSRTGFFTVLTGGFDYAKGKYKPLGINFGGPNEDDLKMKKFEGIQPNITFGVGISAGGSKFHRALIFIDVGLKRGFANLFLAFVF